MYNDGCTCISVTAMPYKIENIWCMCVCVCACVRVCVRVRACVRMCACARVRACACLVRKKQYIVKINACLELGY